MPWLNPTLALVEKQDEAAFEILPIWLGARVYSLSRPQTRNPLARKEGSPISPAIGSKPFSQADLICAYFPSPPGPCVQSTGTVACFESPCEDSKGSERFLERNCRKQPLHSKWRKTL